MNRTNRKNALPHIGNPRPGQGSTTNVRKNPSHPFRTSFSLNCTNIRGLYKNFNCIQQYVETEHPDVLFLTETQVARDCYAEQYLKNAIYILI